MMAIKAMLLAAAMALTLPADAADAVEPAAHFDMKRPEIRRFIAHVAARNKLDAAELTAMIARAVPQPKILEAISKPAEKTSPWWQYRARFITEQRIREGAEFWQQHRERLEQVEQQSGVDASYVVAIIGVETFYGRIAGNWRVLDALTTLAFDYPQRGEFFRSELEQFVLLARDEKLDIDNIRGSYAGAVGGGQFMPSSYRRYAIDGGGDGARNLFRDWDDVIASVANYFKAHGWRSGEPVLFEATADAERVANLDPRNLEFTGTLSALRKSGVVIQGADALDSATQALLLPAELQDRPNVRVGLRNFQVITRYNRSVRYAMAVHDLAVAVNERVQAPDL